MSYTNGLDDPSAYFQIELYTGDGNTPRSHTFDSDTDMQPDLIWLKKRNTDGFHVLTDSVRGAGKQITANNGDGESTNSNGGYVSAFGTDGFTTTNGSVNDFYVNTSGSIYIAWSWKKSATSGFDIVTYTGNGSDRDISHSAGAAPHWMMVKNRTGSDRAWNCYHDGLGADKRLFINTTDSVSTASTAFTDEPTSSVMKLGTNVEVNENTVTYLSYIWAPIQGFSKFGKYVGNGDADGPMVFTGMRSAFIIIKNADDNGNNWFGFSYNTAGFNGETNHMVMNEDEADVTNNLIDILSNGFKVLSTSGGLNTSGSNYVYCAWAEQPFVNSNGVPCNAR